MKHGNKKRAAIAAGYAAGTATGTVIGKAKAVQAALDEARNKSITTAAYNADAAMKEADEAIAFAKETENANAYVKAVELKAKLKGLLVEKHQHQVATFNLSIGGIDDEPKPGTIEVMAETVTNSKPDEDEEDVFS